MFSIFKTLEKAESVFTVTLKCLALNKKVKERKELYSHAIIVIVTYLIHPPQHLLSLLRSQN